VVLSLARSRLALVSQLLFLGANGLGLLLGKIYNLKTPDLYEGNMHHSLGWALNVILMVQFVVRVCQTYASVGTWEKTNSEEHEAFIPISAQVMEHHEAIQGLNEQTQSRFSRDSGHGTDPETFPSQSVTPSLEEPRKLEEDTLDMNSGRTYDGSHSANSGILLWVSCMLSGRTLRVLNRLSDMTDVLILPLGFVAVISGMVIYGGVFVRASVISQWRARRLTAPSGEIMCSTALRIPSKAASSSGMGCLRWAGGWALLPSTAGHGM
jgi:hypothetical protein